MEIYRVYRSYHESSESGTVEYGYYSSLEAAKRRALEVWKTNYGDLEPEDLGNGSLYAATGWDSVSIYVRPIEVDVVTEQTEVGYT